MHRNTSNSYVQPIRFKKNKHHFRILDTNSLLIQRAKTKLSGLYNCFYNSSSVDEQFDVSYNEFNYFVQIVDEKNQFIKGSTPNWIQYQDNVIKPLNSEMTLLSNNNESCNVNMQWDEWGQCRCGSYAFDSKRYRNGHCYVEINKDVLFSPILPCQSVNLNEFCPSFSAEIRNLSDYRLFERCIDKCIPGVFIIIFLF